ncbi:hypothetical protein [Amycolatopsis marina]|uniref:hypothetical protein n=1 Tax=Amycolatopsis marina TaxID=490629 RepID=UPI00116087D7|nr:hypothetical protein [Amycolatopsis marina]
MYEMKQLAQVSPRAAILESFARLEKTLREIVEMGPENEKGRHFTSARELARRAADQGFLTPSELSAFDDVSVLRNTVAHRRDTDIDTDRALEYTALVRQLIIALALAKGRTIADGPIT